MASPRRVVLLGKTGVGKSSLANTIFGDDNVFPVNHSPSSDNSACRSVTRTVYGRTLTLIDTPGLFDTNPTSSGFTSEAKHCLEMCTPGPHAFLLVLKLEKYTKQEKAVVDLILQYFSPEALRFTTVVFTHGDDLPHDKTITEWAQGNDALRDLLRKCGNRCHVVDNRRWRNQGDVYRNNQNRVQDLLNTIDLTVAGNGGSHYTNDLLQNKSLWMRFVDAPLGVQIALVLGVAVVGCLLYYVIPWAQIIAWVIEGATYGAAWIWANLPTIDAIKRAIEYLSYGLTLFNLAKQVYNSVSESFSSCSIQ